MARRSKIEPAEVLKLKQMLWDGTGQQEVARHFGLSQATVSRIQNGDHWATVRWPDGSFGPMPMEREREIARIRNPHIVLRGAVRTAVEHGVDPMEVAAQVEKLIERQEEEEFDQLLLTNVSAEEEPPALQDPVEATPMVTAKQWEALKKRFPSDIWKGAKDLIAKTAVYRAVSGSDDIDGIPLHAIKAAIAKEEERLRAEREAK